MDSSSAKICWGVIFDAANVKIGIVCQVLDSAIGIRNGTPFLWNATKQLPRFFQDREICERSIANSIGRG
jgi:hypothetical protein